MTAATEHLGVLAKQAGAAIADLAAGDLDSLVEPELADLLVDLLGMATQLEAVTAHVAARVDASKIWTNDGSQSCAAWLGRTAHRDSSDCNAIVKRGRQLRRMPLVDAAHTAGRCSARHVSLLAKAADAAPENFADDEEWLVARATELRFSSFVRLVNHWITCAAPDDAEDEALRRYRNRNVRIGRGMHGAGLMSVDFEPIGFTQFTTALDRIAHELWAADWAQARERLGDRACAADLARSAAQRRYDALIEMARRSAAVPEGARAPRPLITVHVDHETLAGRICELSNGTVVTPGEVLPLLCDADIERAVFDPKGRVIDLGRRSRLFVGATRRAVEIRDRSCTHTTCNIPAELCDVDHVEEWEHGGETNADNGRLRCPSHHSGRRRRTRPRPRGGASETDGDASDGSPTPQ